MKKLLTLIANNPALTFTLTIYAAINLVLVMCKGYTPDEIWFYNAAPEAKGAYLYYGHIYWVYLKLLHNMDILRGLSYFYLFSIPIILIAFGRNLKLSNSEQLLTILIWLTCPIAWWRGKLIGPELISLFISLIGLYYFYQAQPKQYQQKKILLGFIMMSIGAAIKLNNIVFSIYAGSLYIFNRIDQTSVQKNFKDKDFYLQLSQIIIVFLSSFWVSTGAYAEDFAFPQLTKGISLFELQFEPPTWTWDFMLVSSLPQASIAIPALFVALLFYKIDRYTASFLLVLVITLVVKVRMSFAWYYLPITTLWLIAFLHSIKNRPNMLLWLLFLTNGVCQFPTISELLYIRSERIYADYTWPMARQEIKKIIQKNTKLDLKNVVFFGFDYHLNEAQNNTLPLLGKNRELKKWHTLNNRAAVITLSPIYQNMWNRNQLLAHQNSYPIRLFREKETTYLTKYLGNSHRRDIFLVKKQ